MKPHHDYVRLWVASLETQNFNFTAYDATEEGALFALEQALKVHAEQYGLETDWWVIYEDSVYVHEVALGHAYRHGSYQPIYAP
jgi:hypothetical protein